MAIHFAWLLPDATRTVPPMKATGALAFPVVWLLAAAARCGPSS